MRMRWGLGPVFACESLLGARRWQVYASRSSFVLVLLAGMTCIWISNVARPFALARPAGANASYKQMAEIGKGFFYALTGVQVSLILLAAPAAAAGSLGMDRARGTILHMMVTDLSDTEIVLGTLAARLVPVVGLVACAVPVAALGALLGGIDFAALAGAFVVSLALALLGCSVALTLSIWVTRTHEVLMAVYMAVGLWLLSVEVWEELSASSPRIMAPPNWFWKANPYVLVFAPYYQPGYAGFADFATFVTASLALSAALIGLSIATLRRVVVEQSGRTAKGVGRRRWGARLGHLFPSWPTPSLDGSPVLWREWHRNRPSRLARWLWTGLLVLAWSTAAWGTYGSLTEGVTEGASPLVGGLLFFSTFGLLMVSAAAPTTLAEERARGSLDVLLATPLATREIVVAKWWGAYRRVLIMLPLFVYAGFWLAVAAPDLAVKPAGTLVNYRPEPLTPWVRLLAGIFCPADFLASGALLVSLGLALATWVRQLGRAVALSVIGFFLIGLAWPISAELFFAFVVSPFLDGMVNPEWLNQNRWLMECVTSLSPVGGPITPLEVYQWYHSTSPWFWPGLGLVIATKATAAGLLLFLTVMTFDRCMGRVSESASPPRREEPLVLKELVPSATL